MRTEMRHLIIMLPGIMGSVLQKDGKDVWALSGQALGQHLRSLGSLLNELRIVNDDDTSPDLGDGVAATRLIEDLHSVPFLVEHAGYSVMRRRIREYFDVSEGSIDAPHRDENFFPFPYDWRRDNRATARKLQHFVQQQLPMWREWSGAKDAQVLLIGHSMGGLVSRYYLEVLEGWRDCRALVTVGSPHRGAVKALHFLSNGLMFRNITDLVRSFRSAYQILPTYPVLEVNGSYVRVGEASEVPNVDQQLVQTTRVEFLEAIRQAAMDNRSDPEYRQQTIPWIGTRQDTIQSASLHDGKVVIRYDAPPGVHAGLADGDGTVARVSALPADLEGQGYERFAVEKHGWLTNNEMTLEPLLDTLKQIALPGTAELYGEPETKRPSLNLRLESLFLSSEPVRLQVKLLDTDDEKQNLKVIVDPIGHPGTGMVKTIQAQIIEATSVEFGALTPGLYQTTIRAQTSSPKAPTPIHGVFEVVNPVELD
jgi:pimeloyl-ACP methyl ester carboxylesterase